MSAPRSLIRPRGLRQPAQPVLDPYHPLSRGLIGCWLLNGVSAPIFLKDIGPAKLDGTPILFTTAQFSFSHHGGTSLTFGGVAFGTTVNLGTSALLKPPLPISFSLWLWKAASYSSVTNDACFNNDGIFGPTNYSGVGLEDGGSSTVEIDFGDGTAFGRRSKVGTTSLSLQTWYHIVGVLRGATDMSIYVNGVDDGGSYSGTGGALAYTGQAATIGKYGTHYFNGQIEGFRLYNRGLSDKEAQWLYAEPYAGIYESWPAYQVGVAAAAGVFTPYYYREQIARMA